MVEVDSNSLNEHIDVLRQINDDVLIPAEVASSMDIRIYYIFKENNRELLEVYMWGEHANMFVNGVEVKENNIFHDIVLPFLPEYMVYRLGLIYNKGE